MDANEGEIGLFSCTLGLHDQVMIIWANGHLDLTVTRRFRESTWEALALFSPPRLVISLENLVSCDPAGLGVLIGANRRAVELGGVLVLSTPNWQLAQLLSVTRLDRRFRIRADITDAVTEAADFSAPGTQ
ncbi:STAS domain-containing protein [Herbidospora sp. RD11066]